MNSNELFQGIDLLVKPAQLVELSRISWDSRKVKPGDLFVALVGSLADGHDYIAQAIANGASALLVERTVESDLPQFVVKNTREAMAQAAANFYHHPSQELTIALVTASNGKTTTTGMLTSIFREAGRDVGVVGTVEVSYHDVHLPSLLTTPESVDLQRHLRAMSDAGVTHVCMEASSIGIESHRLTGVVPAVVTLNNITREHLDVHGTFENYLNVKKSLLRGLVPPAKAVYNLDQPDFSDLSNLSVDTMTFSAENPQADVVVENLDLSTGRAKFDVVLKAPIGQVAAGSFPIELSIPGFHSVANALSAITMALLLGESVKDIQAGLRAFQGAERRFEFIYEKDFVIVDDHFANRGNINVTLKTLEFMEYNQLHMIYAIRGNRGVETNKDNAEGIVEWFSKLPFASLIATLSRDHTMYKDTVSEAELKVFSDTMKAAGIEYVLTDNLEEAIALGLSQVQPGDVLLLAGCQGMDYGGHIALMQLEQLHPEFDKSELYAPIKDRIAGIVGRDYDE